MRQHTTDTATTTAGAGLAAEARGRVLLPGDAGFEAARRPWNRAVDQPVAAVVEAADADDVAAVVRHARRAGLAVAVQPNGHGPSGGTDGAILLRTGLLDEVEIHPRKRWARVGAGAAWGPVLAAAARHGLTGPAGSSPLVSVTGYTLGGGQGWFSRRYGLAADGVRAFDTVTADGRTARVTAESDPDLFWALRGGGGDFAVVTAVEFDLLPVPSLYGGRLLWPGHRAAEVFAAFRELTATAPPELSLWMTRVEVPQAPPMVALDTAYLGPEDEGAALLRGFDAIGGALSDRRATMSPADLGAITGDPTEPGPSLSRAELLTRLDARVEGALTTDPVDPLLTVQLRHLGGAMADTGRATGAHGPLTEPYLLYTVGLAPAPEAAAAVAARQAALVRGLGTAVSGRKPFTFLSPGEDPRAAFPAPALARLRGIKRDRDPRGVIRSNFPVLEGL
ncbi:FAD/FMN-containing dehydrogenase [Nocardiopsis sp. Huas11]|uniref:FAD-binding oxidoreductase n=1 Tax=Nocardiopsis sp. Huas11 TaxID=2183912 RepID=UPI000EAF1977|nr:FAD-binding oxidoreductase [Nocardiopsis sp. Huas11]RKS05844.1 FAD/FMN-containing dehydrogenase [Nocardiopsis sp. Huas11]